MKNNRIDVYKRQVLGKSKIVIVSCTLILAGGMGNLIDRVFRDGVIDFFYFKLIDFAIFNVADSFVAVSYTHLLATLISESVRGRCIVTLRPRHAFLAHASSGCLLQDNNFHIDIVQFVLGNVSSQCS